MKSISSWLNYFLSYCLISQHVNYSVHVSLTNHSSLELHYLCCTNFLRIPPYQLTSEVNISMRCSGQTIGTIHNFALFDTDYTGWFHVYFYAYFRCWSLYLCSALELFLIKRKIKGPSWLSVSKFVTRPSTQRVFPWLHPVLLLWVVFRCKLVNIWIAPS